MTVSIIIPTYNGANKICNILQSLENQSTAPNEIIVVVDGSTDNTMDVLSNTIFNLPQLKIIEQENRGRAAVRNRGASIATSEVLIFLDDDMIAHSNLIEEHITFHKTYLSSICVGVLIPNKSIANTDYGRYRVWLNDQWNKQLNPEEDIVLLSYPYICAANFSLNKIQFIAIGSFDERLNDAEDYDLAVRFEKEKTKIYLNKKCVVVNNDTDAILNCTNTIKRQRQYRYFHQKLIKLKPEIHKGGIREIILPNKLKIFVYKTFFCTKWMIEAVNNERLLFLPKRIRYKIYDAVITANGVLFPDLVEL